MVDDELAAFVLQRHQTEKLSIRQISAYCGLCRKTISRIIRDEGKDPSRYAVDTLVKPYWRLIESWYAEYPKLKAVQVFERLKGLGFAGCCSTVERATRKLRTKKPVMFHERVLLPAEEAQVDWMVLTLPWGNRLRFRLYPGLVPLSGTAFLSPNDFRVLSGWTSGGIPGVHGGCPCTSL